MKKLIFRLHQKRITFVEVIDFLKQMLKHHKYRNVVVVMDQARPHVSQRTQLFINIKEQKRLHVFYLPFRSPDLNPDEQVWNHLKHQELKGNASRTKKELKNLTNRKSRNPELLNGIFFRSCMASFLN